MDQGEITRQSITRITKLHIRNGVVLGATETLLSLTKLNRHLAWTARMNSLPSVWISITANKVRNVGRVTTEEGSLILLRWGIRSK
jgi:hypothetical protein